MTERCRLWFQPMQLREGSFHEPRCEWGSAPNPFDIRPGSENPPALAVSSAFGASKQDVV